MCLRAALIRVLVLAVIAGAGLVAAPAPAATPAAQKYGTKVMRLVNKVRDNQDRVRLKRHRCLQGFADRQATRLAKAQPDPDELKKFHVNLGKVRKKCKFGGWLGENLVFGPGYPKNMVKAWMNSPAHRSNILWRPFRLTGVGARKGGGYWWVSQLFGDK